MSYSFDRGLRHGLPIFLGYFSVSIAFGIQAANMGLLPVQAGLMSLAIFAGAGQFALLLLLSAGAGVLEAALTILVVNLRYVLMSFSIAQRLEEKISTWLRALMGFWLTDEVYAVAVSQPVRVTPGYYAGLGLISQLGWMSGTILGATMGQLLPEAVRQAMNIAIYAMFIAIILPPMRREQPMMLAVLAAMGISVALRVIPLFSALSGGISVLIAAVLGAGIAAWLHPIKEGTP